MNNESLNSWIDAAPDVRVVIVDPVKRATHCGFRSVTIAIRDDASYVWSVGVGFADYAAVLVDGNHPKMVGELSEDIGRQFDESPGAEVDLRRCTGYVRVSWPFFWLLRGDDFVDWHKDVLSPLNDALRESDDFGLARGAPMRCSERAARLRNFVEDFARPLPPLSCCLRVSADDRKAIARRDFSDLAAALERSAEINVGSRDDRRREAMEMQLGLLRRMAARQVAAQKKFQRGRRGRKANPNFFSMVEASKKLTQVNYEK